MNDTHFDDQGHPVGVQQPEVYSDDPESDDRARREIISRLIDWTIQGAADPESIGRRLLILGHLCRTPSAPATQRELARRLGVTEAAVSKQVKRFRAILAGM